jgi:hypothetical protein
MASITYRGIKMDRKDKHEEETIEETQDESVEDEFEDEEEQEEIDPIESAIKQAFVNAIESELDEDGVKMEMIGAGAKFKNVTRYYNLFMVELGYVKSKKEREEILDGILNNEDLADEEVLNACSASIQEQVEVSEKSANAMLRQWAKKHEIEYFKKPKAEPTTRDGLQSKIFSWIVANFEASTDADLEEFLGTLNSENAVKRKGYFTSVLRVAKEVAKQYV